MTTWSREVNGSSVRGVFRSYELVDGVFLPIRVNSHNYVSSFCDPSFFYMGDQIVTCAPTDFLRNVSPTIYINNYVALFSPSLDVRGTASIQADFEAVKDAPNSSLVAFDKTRNLMYWYTGAANFSSTNFFPYGNEQYPRTPAGFITAYKLTSETIKYISSETASNPINYSYGVLAYPIYYPRNVQFFRSNSLTVSPDGRYLTWINGADHSPNDSIASVGLKIYNNGGLKVPYENTRDYANGASYNHALVGSDVKLDGTSTVSILSSILPTHVQWTADSRYLITANSGTTLPINVFKEIDKDFVKVSAISNIPRNVYNIISSPDNRTLAVVVEGSGGIGKDTLIYKRTGSYFNLSQTIEKFGLAMSFNGSGSIIVDVSERKAYRLDDVGQFVEDTKLMSKVVAGATALAISDHVQEPPVSGFIYDNTIPLVVSEHKDISNLSICLLSNDAVFNRKDVTIDDVTGVAANKPSTEVNGFGWPFSGMNLINAKMSTINGSVIMTANDIVCDIAGGALRFGKAVIYDNATRTALLWFDFGHEVIVESNSRLVIEFSSKGFLVFAP